LRLQVCEYFEGFDNHGSQSLLEPGVYTLEKLNELGKKNKWCPYFTARHMIKFCNVIVYNYNYVIDPKISQLVSRDIEKESILVFDEAHNIDNVCIEALSVHFNKKTLEGATRNLSTLGRAIDKCKEKNAEQLRNEYNRLLQGMQRDGQNSAWAGVSLADALGGDPAIGGLEGELEQLVPGDIMQASSFVSFMRKVTSLHFRVPGFWIPHPGKCQIVFPCPGPRTLNPSPREISLNPKLDPGP